MNDTNATPFPKFGTVDQLLDFAKQAHADRAELRTALEQIAELEGDCEQQQFKLTRFQAAQIARAAIAKCKP